MFLIENTISSDTNKSKKKKYIEILVSQNPCHFFLQAGMIVGKTHLS